MLPVFSEDGQATGADREQTQCRASRTEENTIPTPTMVRTSPQLSEANAYREVYERLSGTTQPWAKLRRIVRHRVKSVFPAALDGGRGFIEQPQLRDAIGQLDRGFAER